MQLEKKFGVDLVDRKDVIGKIVVECVEKMEEDEESEDEKEASSASASSESEEEEEVKEKPKKRAAATAAASRKRKSAGGDSDSEWGKKKKPKGRGGGYTRPCKLSPALADLVGASSLPRYEVVKQVWAIIKQNNLYDPNNRQFALCDDALYSVIGTKRFRIFGMMKYLKNHFLDD